MLSTFGVMFVPKPERAAEEMLRVTQPGGRIGLANWTPTGFIGQMFKIVGAHVPPPAGVPSPLQWGTEERLAELFGGDAHVDVTRRHFVFRYQSAQHFFDTFITYYGPTLKAWGALDDAGRESFRSQLVALATSATVTPRRTLGAVGVPRGPLTTSVLAMRRVVAWVARFASRLLFRRVEVAGIERYPTGGPSCWWPTTSTASWIPCSSRPPSGACPASSPRPS